MNRYKKATNIIYLYSVYNIYSNCMDHISENIFQLKISTKLQNVMTFCENRNNKNNIKYEKSSDTILKIFENEKKKNSITPKEIQKKKFIDNLNYKNVLNNENSLTNEKGENEKNSNYEDNFVSNEKDYFNTINKSNKLFNETKSNEKNEEKTMNNNKNDDKINNYESYDTEKNNKEEGGDINTMNKSEDELNEDMINLIENILKKHNIVLFMKGTALNPFCKYSKQAIHILKLNKVKEIHTVNILDNEKLRNSLKIYSKWPTFPQLYINSKFIGGIDKVQELHDSNKLKELIENS
ncbi:Cg6 protein, putative [Plasmodium gallinaceum]|uniref:Cg6 protein, putative n=1 Tax=Plasmodium gallinaceum TaxID=5849 RepID=A0A1J1H0G7_PLAGA|nr:Cg6 protein, putative [Plasmodium gallinaceum]CRG98059.1 Cg6 protein, putative [Plasmodium gallinaceum]